jgi:hypothetical protein
MPPDDRDRSCSAASADPGNDRAITLIKIKYDLSRLFLVWNRETFEWLSLLFLRGERNTFPRGFGSTAKARAMFTRRSLLHRIGILHSRPPSWRLAQLIIGLESGESRLSPKSVRRSDQPLAFRRALLPGKPRWLHSVCARPLSLPDLRSP